MGSLDRTKEVGAFFLLSSSLYIYIYKQEFLRHDNQVANKKLDGCFCHDRRLTMTMMGVMIVTRFVLFGKFWMKKYWMRGKLQKERIMGPEVWFQVLNYSIFLWSGGHVMIFHAVHTLKRHQLYILTLYSKEWGR